MNLKTISFVGNSEPPGKLLEIFKKMTPGSSGIWGQLKGCDHYNTDYHGVIDWLPPHLGLDPKKCVYLGAHPPESHYAYKDMRNYVGIKMYDAAHTVGFLEWWLEYDYDYLKKLEPMIKSNPLCAIVSHADTQIYHKKRLTFLDRFCSNSKLIRKQAELEADYRDEGSKPTYNWFDLYGRIQPNENMKKFYRGHCGNRSHTAETNHMIGKEKVYSSHAYALEFDAIGEHYFSERVLDCLLMWCYPIYWGGRSLAKYIPKESFSYLDIDSNGDTVLEITENDNLWQRALPYIKEARRILMDELQLWPRIHHAIFGTYQ